MSIRFGWCLLLLGLCFSGCEDSKGKGPGGPLSVGVTGKFKIVTTCGMVTDIVREVTGPRADVTGLIHTGVDPHLYRSTPEDNRLVQEADIVFYTGLKLEGPLEDGFRVGATAGKRIFAVTDDIPKEKLHFQAGFGDHPDPHVWNSVSLWSLCVERVAQQMMLVDPPHAVEYRVRADRYREELKELDQFVHACIQSIPEDRRYMVTAHDAFEYFSAAYGIPVHAVQGITTETEPGVKDIRDLVDFVVEHKVSAVFVEEGVNEGFVRSVIEGAAARGWQVEIGGKLFSDSMGKEGTHDGTYIGMLEHNAIMLAQRLGGKVPERPKMATKVDH